MLTSYCEGLIQVNHKSVIKSDFCNIPRSVPSHGGSPTPVKYIEGEQARNQPLAIEPELPLADLGGVPGTCLPLRGHSSFVFTHIITKKRPRQRSMPTPVMGPHFVWKILDLPLVTVLQWSYSLFETSIQPIKFFPLWHLLSIGSHPSNFFK